MPTLVLDEPEGSVLHEACHAALREQVDFAVAHDVPWGISESAYAGSDHTLAYQYAPQGVPRLALRRTPSDELVVAPYATALAAQIAPQRARRNFEALQALGARARYGFIEALDFTPARQSGTARCMPVNTFMAHHQGMSIVALANVLLQGAPRRWGMAIDAIQAVASLLHERAPREISTLSAPAPGPGALEHERRALGLLREVLPGGGALEPTHLLSNGRYSVSLRANGAGGSRWGDTGITRWRDDALRDAYGSFFYLRWPAGGDESNLHPVSITQHPAPDPQAFYRSSFHADRVCFESAWPELQAHTTVWVSPEDDIEFRQVELHNLGEQWLEIELISAFEVTLSAARADEAHPAFTNLFVRAEWQPAQRALCFERKPRLPTEPALRLAHFLADSDPQVTGVRVLADRQRWLGRNRDASQPLADFDPWPAAGAQASGDAVVLDTGLDPVCAFSVRLRIAPLAKAKLTFATAASDQDGTLRAVIDKYLQPSHVQRASLMSATLAGIRLRGLRVNAETFAAIQSLSTALVLSLTRPRPAAERMGDSGGEICDRRLLWRFGISGDRPLLLVSAGEMHGLGLLRSLAQGLRIWAWGGVACDLVVVNSEPASYQLALQRELVALRERHAAESAALAGTAGTALFVLRAEELSSDEFSTLQNLARVHLQADGRPLLHHVQAWVARHEQALELRQETSTTPLTLAAVPTTAVPVSKGEFAAVSGEFRFDVSSLLRPTRPWINVLSNPHFGAQVSEAGGGYTWAVNSRMNQLTAWSNDPVADPPSEMFLIQDRKSMQVWSVTPGVCGDAGDEAVVYRVAHGQGTSLVSHRRGPLEVSVSWCVDAQHALKQVRLRLVNRGHRTLHLRIVGIAEWMMGANRSDRATVRTALYRQRLPDLPADSEAEATARTQTDRVAVHAARGRSRLRQRHGLPRAGRRRAPGRRLELRSARTLRCSRPRGAARPLRQAAGQRAGPLRRAVHPRQPGAWCEHRARVPARLCRKPRSGAPAGHACCGRERGAAAGAGAQPVGPAARCGHRAHPRPAVRRAGQPLAAVPDGVVPAVGQGGLLSGGRGHGLSRPVAGRAGPGLGRAGAAARADRARGIAPVSPRRCAALVACAGRCGRAHAFLGRPAVAALCRRALPACERRCRAARRSGAVHRRCSPSPTAPRTPTTRRPSAMNRLRCTNTRPAPSTAACAWACTACH